MSLGERNLGHSRFFQPHAVLMFAHYLGNRELAIAMTRETK